MLKDFADIKEHIAQLRASHNTGSTNLHEQDDALRQLEVSFEFWARWVRTYLERTNICINLVRAFCTMTYFISLLLAAPCLLLLHRYTTSKTKT